MLMHYNPPSRIFGDKGPGLVMWSQTVKSHQLDIIQLLVYELVPVEITPEGFILKGQMFEVPPWEDVFGEIWKRLGPNEWPITSSPTESRFRERG